MSSPLVRPCLGLFLSFLRSFLPDILLLSCIILVSFLLFPCAKYTVWDTHPVHGIQLTIVHAEWSLVL